MKLYRIYLSIPILILASLACQTLTGGPNASPTSLPANDNSSPDVTPPTPATSNENNTEGITSSDFPMTPDAFNVTEAGGSLVFYTKLSLEETMQFYRDEYTSRGYTERESSTVVSGGTFSMVFDGDPSGKAVVVQSVDLGDGSRTVAIRLEDV